LFLAVFSLPADAISHGPSLRGVEPLLEGRAGEDGFRAGQQATRLVESPVGIGWITDAFNPQGSTAPGGELYRHIHKVLRARASNLRDRFSIRRPCRVNRQVSERLGYGFGGN
jgi:hypothetical protein